MNKLPQRLAPLVFALSCALPASAAEPATSAAVISAAERNAAIAEMITDLTGNYVFPEVAEKMAAAIKARQQRGEYELVTDGKAFAKLLEQHLQEVSHDKHIQIRYQPGPGPDSGAGKSASVQKEQPKAFGRSVNYGFEKFERLEPNVAYLELRGFIDPQNGAADTVAAAMGMAANADALIIDLRRNGGGSPRMVALISSYLFDQERVHLNDLYWRDGNRTEEFWTNPDVAGRLGSKKPVYVLTSKATFSAAEEFAYNLKQLKRAVIVGEVTGGGANPGRGFKFSEHVGGFIPTGRAINPVTHANWEGTGVLPDVAVPAEQALSTALSLAAAASPAK